MSNKEFENKVLNALGILQTDVSGIKGDITGLKEDVSGLKCDIARLDKKIDNNTNRLEELINNNHTELSNQISNQGHYINQAFDIITTIQNDKANQTFSKV